MVKCLKPNVIVACSSEGLDGRCYLLDLAPQPRATQQQQAERGGITEHDVELVTLVTVRNGVGKLGRKG